MSTDTDPAAVEQDRPPALRRAAIIIGASTLAMAVLGMAAGGLILGLQGADAAGTAARIAEAPMLLRVVIVCFLAVAVLDIVLAWALWRYFGADQGGLVTLAAWLRVGYAAVLVVAVGELANALRVVTETGWGSATDAHGMLGAFNSTWQLGLIVFAAHLAVLAMILIREPGTPTAIGIVIGLAAFGYAADGIARILLPADAAILSVLVYVVAIPSVVGEVGLGIWFLLRGGRVRPGS